MDILRELLYFILSLAGLILSAKFFTNAAETIGRFLRLPQFVIGVFIVGIGTSLPELISGIMSVSRGASEVMPGNVIGANVSNVFLITGLCVVLNKGTLTLRSKYIFIDLHFLVGSFFFFAVIAWDGVIEFSEAFLGIVIYLVYAFYLIRGEAELEEARPPKEIVRRWYWSLPLLLASSAGIYFSADFTLTSLANLSELLRVPQAIVSVTLLSLGTTLPELAVNVRMILNRKAEMAVGNVLGSSVFNALMIPSVSTLFGTATLPDALLFLPLPIMAAAGLLFYLLTHDKNMSVWEGLLFICLYGLFIVKVMGG